MPWVTFTDPEIAHIGLTEKEARGKFGDITILHIDANLDRFVTESKTMGFFKIILDKNDTIIGKNCQGGSMKWLDMAPIP